MTMQTSPPSTPSASTSPDAGTSDKIVFDKFFGKRSHDEVVQLINAEYNKCKSARARIEYQWYVNIAFYMGLQNIKVIKAGPGQGGASYKFHVPPAPYWRARPVINLIRPIIRTELSKITSQKPDCSVIPASSDDRDLFAAQAGEQIWDSTYRRKNIKHVIQQAAWWQVICGNGFIKDWWDWNLSDNFSDQMGDFGMQAETPFHIYVPDLMEPDIEDQPYVIHASVRSLDWVKLRYSKGLDGRDIMPNVKSASILQASFLNLMANTDSKPDSVLCLEMWIKPGSMTKFPNGAMFTLVGDQIVEAVEGWPYEHGEYPFIKFDHIPTGRFYTESIITDVVPLQKEYNRTRGQIIEAKNIMAKPRLMGVQGSVNPAQITNEPGQVVLVKPGFPMPVPLPMDPLPAYVLQEQERIKMDIDDISGQHEVTKGRVPPGVTAATAISYLQEQDDSKLAHTIDSLEMGVEKLARHTLSHVAQFWDTRRKVKVVGNDGFFDVLEFERSDLRGNTDVRVESGSALPTSKAAKQAFILDLMKMGFIDPNKGLEVLEIGGVNKLYESIQLDVRHAQRENIKMQNIDPMMAATPNPMTGTPDILVPVNSWDNHQVHVEIHNKFRKSEAFDAMPDEVKIQFEMHVNMHLEILASSMPPVADNSPVANSSAQQPNRPMIDPQSPPTSEEMIPNG